MAKRVSDLRTTNKSAKTTSKYLFVSDISNNESTKIALDDVFPALQSGIASGSVSAGSTGNTLDLFVGGGTGSSTKNTNKSTLIFRGFSVEDDTGSQTNALSTRIDTSQSDPNKQNIVVKLDATRVDANSLKNTTSKFISEVGGKNPLSLSSGGTHFSGTLGIRYGGTGKTSGTANSLLSWSDSSTISDIRLVDKGSLLTNNGSNITHIGVGTNGYVLSANSSTSTGLEWISTSGLFTGGTLSADLNMNGNNVVLAGGKLSGSGVGGINIANSTGKVYVGAGTVSYTETLTVDGSMSLTSDADRSLYLNAHSSATPPEFTVQGADAEASSGRAGGDLTISAGDGDTNGYGGDLTLAGGVRAGTGRDGTVTVKVGTTAALVVDDSKDVNIKSGSLVLDTSTEGIVHKGSTTVAQATDWTTGVTTNGTSGVITLESTDVLGNHGSHEFQVTNSTVQADSLVFLQWMDLTGTTTNMMGCYVSAIASGSFNVRIFNPRSAGGNTTAGDIRIAFLIINNSV